MFYALQALNRRLSISRNVYIERRGRQVTQVRDGGITVVQCLGTTPTLIRTCPTLHAPTREYSSPGTANVSAHYNARPSAVNIDVQIRFIFRSSYFCQIVTFAVLC